MESSLNVYLEFSHRRLEVVVLLSEAADLNLAPGTIRQRSWSRLGTHDKHQIIEYSKKANFNYLLKQYRNKDIGLQIIEENLYGSS